MLNSTTPFSQGMPLAKVSAGAMNKLYEKGKEVDPPGRKPREIGQGPVGNNIIMGRNDAGDILRPGFVVKINGLLARGDTAADAMNSQFFQLLSPTLDFDPDDHSIMKFPNYGLGVVRGNGPVEANEVAFVSVFGREVVQINVADASHKCAVPRNGDPSGLDSAKEGPFRILGWHQDSGKGVVYFPIGGGGSGGDAPTPEPYMYLMWGMGVVVGAGAASNKVDVKAISSYNEDGTVTLGSVVQPAFVMPYNITG